MEIESTAGGSAGGDCCTDRLSDCIRSCSLDVLRTGIDDDCAGPRRAGLHAREWAVVMGQRADRRLPRLYARNRHQLQQHRGRRRGPRTPFAERFRPALLNRRGTHQWRGDHRLVVTPVGSVAWIIREHHLGESHTRVMTARVSSGTTLLDEGPGIISGSLRLARGVLSWEDGGVERSLGLA